MKKINNRTSKIIIIITFITFFLIGILGFSYAYYRLQVEGAVTTNTISLGKVDLNFLNTNTLNISNALPIYETYRYTEADYIGFTVSGSTTDFSGCYELVLDITQIDDALKDETFKWEFYDVTDSVTLFTGDFEHNSDINDVSLMAFQSLTLSTNHTYKVFIYIAWDGEKDQTSMLGKTFRARIKATTVMGSCLANGDATLLSYSFSGSGTFPTSFPLKGQGYLGTDVQCTGVDGVTWDNESWALSFENVSTMSNPPMCRVNFKFIPYCNNLNNLNCNILLDSPDFLSNVVVNDEIFNSILDESQTGLWTENRPGKTENNLPVYFYRGAVQNNYVSFAGKKWRIVRINEDGTIKLILGGNSATDGYAGTTVAFNPNYNGTSFVNYGDTNNTLRGANNAWYSTNLNSYNSYIADTKFCVDRTTITLDDTIYYGGYERLGDFMAANNRPQYKCHNSNDNLIYKIGALTIDESVYAGGTVFAARNAYYIYDNAQNTFDEGSWWLLSPHSYSDEAKVFSVAAINIPVNLTASTVNSVLGFRPVISLKADTIILDGNGTFTSPYVITQ